MDDARRVSILGGFEVPDLQNAFDLRDESLEESEVAAGGALDSRRMLVRR
jgi:hypothetical protein